MKNNPKIALIEDHALLRHGLAGLVQQLGCEVVAECNNGKDLVAKINPDNLPDVALMDINMPDMDGFETTVWLRKNHPSVKVLALSMYDDENSIIRMLKHGAKGYILKDITLQELNTAIIDIVTKGFHYTETVTGKMVHTIREMDQDDDRPGGNKGILRLTDRELEFLKLVCTEMTYKEIADQMYLSPRTIDGYREQLFEKLGVKSRIGLVIYAIKNGIVRFN